ncbi:general substrate transporter [Paraphoma chrysanthemicola]|uniref:General substrate transporter n=1 Tax=Paraphoma chrysanthemicola TaxID=798071 RepID=A0A8K0QSI0_9PLEO|nr:general substrate transporter [Paraphoma chrysanthemicola]
MGIMLKKPEGAAGSALPAILVGLFVAFGGVLFGYDTGTIGGILGMTYWKDTFSTGYKNDKGELDVTSDQSSLIVSILSAGTFFGALTAAPAADFLGRRLGLVACNVVFCLGVILQTVATDIPIFVAGRFFAGYGVGMISATIPLYQSETAPKWIRGVIVGAYQLAITIGLLIAAIVLNSTKDRYDTGSYRIPIAVQFAWAIILFVGCIWLPESPRWFVKKGQPEKAANSLSKLRRLDVQHPALVEELAEITANHEYELSLGKATYIDCFKGGLGKRLATGCLLQALQQLTGINFIFYYGTSFFQNAGFSDPFVITMITSAVNVGSTFPGLYLVEKWGRRNLLLFGAFGMAFCQFVVAITGTVAGTDNQAAQNALIAFVCIYIFFFACSWGPVAWVVTGEIFPLKVRAKSLSMTTATNWLLNFGIGYATPYMVNSGPGNANLGAKVFFVWGGCCFICIFFVWSMIYETKGLSLEQVDELYGKVAKAWKSPGFVPTVSFQDVQEAHVDARRLSLTDAEAEATRKRSAQYNEGINEKSVV